MNEVETLRTELERTKAAWGFSMLMVKHYLVWSKEASSPAEGLKMLIARLEHFAVITDENRSVKEEVIKQIHEDVAKKLEPQLDELRAKVRQIEQGKKESEKSKQGEFSVKELEGMLADQRRVIGEQADKLRSPQDVKPLCEAIEILTAAVKMVSPENYKQDYPHMMSVEEYREGHRQFVCDAINAAERLYREVFCSVPCVPEWLFGNPDLPRLWRDFKSTDVS